MAVSKNQENYRKLNASFLKCSKDAKICYVDTLFSTVMYKLSTNVAKEKNNTTLITVESIPLHKAIQH